MSGRARLAVFLALTLTGCGFHPAYMPTAEGNAGVAQRDMSAVFVETIGERSGQLLRQALQERFELGGTGVQRRYSLTVAYGISGEGIAVTPDTLVTRTRVVGDATWYLTAHDPARTRLAVGRARSVDGYNVLNQQYFFVDLSNEDAQKRLAESLADQISIQVAAWFRNHQATVAYE